MHTTLARRIRHVVLCAIAIPLSASGAQATQRHALDPLTAAEITQTVALLEQSGRTTPETRYGTITVQQQPKSGAAANARAARVLGYDWRRNEGFLALVDLDGKRLTSWTVVDSEPPMRLLTIRRAEEAAHADPRWVGALLRRNIDTSRVSVLVNLPERARLPRRGNDRIVSTTTWLRDGIPDALVVDGMDMEVNLTSGRVASFADPRARVGMTDSSATKALANQRAALSPLRISGSSSARIAGNEITWDRWRFRVGVDPRRGIEIHDVSFTDAGRRRPVVYSGSISEIIAPYGDPNFSTWYPRDEGDYGMGIYSMSSAVEGNDVPENASFLGATMHDHRGRPIPVPRAIAIYERDGGLLWRHANESRRARDLVVSGHSTIDNYDYQFNWIFHQDGSIDGEVVLSGIMNTNIVGRNRDTAHAEGHSAAGHLVAPGINAPNHQHFFSYRLDLDIDGTANTVYTMDTQALPASTNPKGEAFSMSERPLARELAARSDVSFATARAWRVANTHQTNALGQFTGYTLAPGAATPSFALASSAPVRQAGFIAHQLWVTPYAPDEVFAAGEFQNLGRDGDGLPRWTAADRPLLDADVVLWYTLGITHIPRPEDWPYMPSHRGGFRLVPTSFFSRNPTLDIPARKP